MHICIVLGLFCFFHCLICINGRCVQSDYDNRNITAVVGQNVTFKCVQLAGCPRYVWRIFPANAIPHVDIPDDMCNTNYKVCATENRNGREVLRLTDVSEYSAEYYQCSCAYPNLPPTAFSCNQLIVVCQAQVTVGDLFMTFNGSHTGSTETSVIDIPEDKLVQVNCLGLSTFTTSCSEGSSTFTATKYHNNCIISCQSAKGCTIKITMNVLNRETTTTSSTYRRASTEADEHHTAAHIASTKAGTSYSKEQMTDGKTHNPVSTGTDMSSNDNYITIVIALVILAIFLLMVAVGLCVYLRSSRTKRKSNSDTKNKSIFPHSTYAAAPTYAMIDKENNGNATAGIDVAELKETTASDALESDVEYSAVNPKPGHAEEKNVKTTMSNISPKKENKNSMNYETVNELQSKLPKYNEDTLNKDDYDTDNIQSSEINSDVDDSKFVHIPEYAEGNHNTTNDDDDVSVLYATVDKTR